VIAFFYLYAHVDRLPETEVQPWYDSARPYIICA